MQQWKFLQPISEEQFIKKYKFHRKSVEEVFNDVATVISSVEKASKKEEVKNLFYEMMINGRFIPAGRILANAWPNTKINNFMNCYTIGIEDDMNSIFDSLKEDAKISKVGGGVGFDVSKLRPKGTPLSVGGEASGPISFLKIFDASAKIIMTGGQRRAAHIALMDVSHPDIEEFVTCKQGDKNNVLSQFNISVKISDKFIKAVEEDKDWNLEFKGKVYKTIKAKALYDMISKNAFEHNEPGIFNVDTVNRFNNGYYAFEIHEVNPCGEICMQKYSVCCLGSLNLTSYVVNPFTNDVEFNWKKFEEDIKLAVRFLDNVLDAADYPLEKIKDQVRQWRRIGLGFTGLGDVFAMMKMKYGSDNSKQLSEKIAKTLRDYSYLASTELAKEKGSFKSFDVDKILKANFIKKLPNSIKEAIKENGLRNLGLNTIAPTGTISLTIGQNCSSGVEPIFALEYNRRIRSGNNPDVYEEQKVIDFAYGLWKTLHPDPDRKIPDYFACAKDVSPKDGIDIQAIFQEYIDHSISKTLNLASGTTFEQYKDLFLYAYKKGLKGFTTFNPDGSMKGILEYNEPKEHGEYIKRRMAPKRPDELECDIHQVTVNGKKIVVLVGLMKGSLYEIFVDDDKENKIDAQKYQSGIIRKVGKGRYDLIVKNGEEKVIVENLSKNFGGTYGSLARLVSMSLRHGTPLQFIVDQLGKSNEFVGFEKSVMRVLKKYIKDGEIVMTGDVCPECQTEMIYKDGCATCPNCAWSKCL